MSLLLQNAVYGGIMILAVAVLRRVLKDKLIPEARLALWAVCLFRLLTPAAPESVLSLWRLLGREAQGAPMPVPDMVSNGAGAYLPPAPVGTASPAPVEAGIPWGAVLTAAWVIVGGLLAARFALSYARTRRAVKCAILLEREDPRYALLPRRARLREGAMDGAPLTFGAARPTVVLTPGLAGEELVCVLAHEGVHVRRRDNLWHYAMALALVVQWWNPAVWLMARLLRRDVELSCDRAAVKKLGAEKRAEYAKTLVSMATAGSGPAFCQTFGRKAAEERIVSIMKYKKTTIAGIVLTLVLVVGVTVAFASNPAAAPEDQSGSPNGGTPYEVCTDPLCTVDYQHCHIDGEVVRAYDTYPGLLCAHPDCEIEGPHEHDGVRYAGKAGKFVILNPDAEPVESAPAGLPDEVLAYAEKLSLGMSRERVHAVLGEPSFSSSSSFSDTYELDPDSFERQLGIYYEMDGTVCQVRYFSDGTDPDCVGFDLTHYLSDSASTVEYDGRTYNRAGLSAETLEWLDWYLALPEEEQLAVNYEPPELWDGETPAVSDAGENGLITEPGEPGVTPPRPVTLEEYEALLKELMSGGKVSQEDADWLLANAKEDMEGQECPYLWVVDGGSYAVMGGKFCTLASCGNNSRHTHNGEWYTGWTGKTTVPPYCTDETCAVSGLHYHENGEVVHCYDASPALLPVCPVEGCTVRGTHTHDGVAYRCNGAHCGGVCDGSCATAWNEADTTPTAAPVSSGHHSDSHHGNGYHGGHH